MVVWIFRAVRKSLEDDGLIGQVTESTFYRTITSIRVILLSLEPLLWGVEIYFGKYLMDPMERLLYDIYHEPDEYGPLGDVLSSPIIQNTNLVCIGWLVFDFVLGLVYSVLERFTLEEHEKAKREYDKTRRELGDVDESDNTRRNFILSFVESTPFRYIQRGVIVFMVLRIASDAGTAIQEEISFIRDTPSPEVTAANLAKINPYRDLLPEQDAVLKEVVYMSHVLLQLTPTSLPDDDYQLFSDMIRSLETRTDVSWRTYEETSIRETILAAANRGRSYGKPVAEEPFSINQRVKALHSHWHDLAIAPEKPERWEDASDTTYLAPLISTHAFGEAAAQAEGAKGFKLSLTTEQDAEATQVYTRWRRDRDRMVSYLKVHPPTPMAWVPVSKTHTGIHNAWDNVFEDGRVEAGRSVPAGKLAGNQQWKPIFRSLRTENVPWGWGEEPQTDEESKAELAALNESWERSKERMDKQDEYIEKLKKMAEEQKKKDEL